MWCCHYFYFIAILQIISTNAVLNDGQNDVAVEFENRSPLIETYKASRSNINEIVKLPLTNNNLAHNRISNMVIPNGYINANIPNAYFSKNDKIREEKQNTSPYNVIDLKPRTAENIPNFQQKADIFAVLDSSSNKDIELYTNENINKVYRWKPKTISLNIGDPYAVKNDNSKFYLQIFVDNIDIKGTVSVRGSLPLYGTVAINGNIPNTGKALVDYGNVSSKKSS